MVANRYVFGPVPSRRLGRSLGLDLVPFKTCTYDCVYCQLGATSNKTCTQREYVPSEEVLSELAASLQTGPPPDCIALAGSGEPTLLRPLDKLIAAIKQLTPLPVVVLTNGSLLWDAQLRAELARADVIMPSLDAGDNELFQIVNRPHPDLTFDRLIEGLIACRREFSGAYWLEIMLLSALTDQPAAVKALAALAREIDPHRIYLNTPVRPPAESWVKPLTPDSLRACAAQLGAVCEIIADFSPAAAEASAGSEQAVLALLRRRPCRIEDLSEGLAIHRNEVLKYLGHLLRTDQICSHTAEGHTYYSAETV